MSIVLDASATIALLYSELPLNQYTALEDTIAVEGAIVPPVWRLEVANALLTGLRLKQHTDAEAEHYLQDLASSNILLDHQSEKQVWSATFMLAVKYKLTSYDASYLELAARLRLPLATLDRALIQAAEAERVPLFLT